MSLEAELLTQVIYIFSEVESRTRKLWLQQFYIAMIVFRELDKMCETTLRNYKAPEMYSNANTATEVF